MKHLFAALALCTLAAPAYAAGLADITNKDAVSGLRQALTDGAAAAVGKLGVENGFFGNAKVGLAEKYNSIAGKGAQLGVINANQSTIEQYVTNKSLDGLYTIIGDEEKALRQNPVGGASSIVQKVFGAIR